MLCKGKTDILIHYLRRYKKKYSQMKQSKKPGINIF